MQQYPEQSSQPVPQASYPQQSPPEGYYPRQPQFPPQPSYPQYPQQQSYPAPNMQMPPYSVQQPGQAPYLAPGAQMPQYPMQPMMQNSVNVNVNVQRSGPGFFVRAMYFLFIGWWLGYIWLSIGFGLCALIITLPLGLMMLNRLPQVMTLKQPGTSTSVNVSTTTMQPMGAPGPAIYQQNINVNIGGTQQQSFIIRAIYFIFIGCWLGYLWANIAYLCCVTLVLLPVGAMMFDRLPAVLTLRRN